MKPGKLGKYALMENKELLLMKREKLLLYILTKIAILYEKID